MYDSEALPMGSQREPERKEIQHPDRKAQGEEQIKQEDGSRDDPHPDQTRDVARAGCRENNLQGVTHHDVRGPRSFLTAERRTNVQYAATKHGAVPHRRPSCTDT